MSLALSSQAATHSQRLCSRLDCAEPLTDSCLGSPEAQAPREPVQAPTKSNRQGASETAAFCASGRAWPDAGSTRACASAFRRALSIDPANTGREPAPQPPQSMDSMWRVWPSLPTTISPLAMPHSPNSTHSHTVEPCYVVKKRWRGFLRTIRVCRHVMRRIDRRCFLGCILSTSGIIDGLPCLCPCSCPWSRTVWRGRPE